MAEHNAMMERFVRDYLELLDHRLESINNHLGQRNFMTAHVALLSLESTSVMVGATGLAEVAGRLRQLVEQGDREQLAPLLAELADEAAQARRDLAA